MANLLTNTLAAQTLKGVKKNWLYGQELEASATVTGQSWNEGYLPTSKFLYFTEATPTIPESKTKLRRSAAK